MLVFLILLSLPKFSYALASSNHRLILNTTLKYRGSTTRSNLYPALRLFMQVQPDENPILLKVFNETCHHLEKQFVIRVTGELFPNFESPDISLTTIPLEMVGDSSHDDQNAVSLSTIISSTTKEKHHVLKMALFEWNYFLLAISGSSPLLMNHLRVNNKTDKIETFRERVEAAKLIHEFLKSHFSMKDAWLLFHMLEYFRHLMLLRPSLFTEKDFSNEQLEQLWIAFAINTLNHNSAAIKPQ